MDILSKENTKVLAEKNGWSLAHAEGFVDGEIFRRRHQTPSMYVEIGIDEYCLGFRAGFYERQNIQRPYQAPKPNLAGLPARHLSQRSRDSAEPIDTAIVPLHGG